MLKGVTSFLEALDQKADEYSKRQNEGTYSDTSRHQRELEEVAKWERVGNTKGQPSGPSAQRNKPTNVTGEFSIAPRNESIYSFPRRPSNSSISSLATTPARHETASQNPALHALKINSSAATPQARQLSEGTAQSAGRDAVADFTSHVSSSTRDFPSVALRGMQPVAGTHPSSTSSGALKLNLERPPAFADADRAYRELLGDYQFLQSRFNDMKSHYGIIVVQLEVTEKEVVNLRAERARRESDDWLALRLEVSKREETIANLTHQLDEALSALSRLKNKMDNAPVENEQVNSFVGRDDNEHGQKWKLELDLESRSHASTRAQLATLQERHNSLLQQMEKEKRGHSDNIGNSSTLQRRDIQQLVQQLVEKQSTLEVVRNESEQWRIRYEGVHQRLRDTIESQTTTSSSMGFSEFADGMSRHHHNQKGGNRAEIRISQAEAQDYVMGDLKRSGVFVHLSRKGMLGRNLAHGLALLDRLMYKAVENLRRSATLRMAVAVYIIVMHCWLLLMNFFLAEPIHGAHATVD